MGGFGEQVLTNTVANLVSAGVLALLTVVVAYAFLLRKRHRLFDFFGVTERDRVVGIYLSRLEIKGGGTTGVRPITTGYMGPALTRAEFMAATQVAKLFESRLIARVPRTLQHWLGAWDVSLEPVQPMINVSPLATGRAPQEAAAEAAAENQTIVIVGSPVYNVLSAYYLDRDSSVFKFALTPENERIFQRREGTALVTIPGRSSNKELGVVQRLWDPDLQCTVFVCAGLGSSGTFGATRYLVHNWAELRSRRGDTDFSICLEFPGQGPDCDGEMNSVVSAVVAWESV